MEANNAAAMRKALLLCYRIIHCAMVAGVINRDDANKAMDAYHAALAAPPRNCDVETAEEQAERFFAFCNSNKCPSCPCRFTKKTDCALIWAQMPYKEGGAE